MHLYICFLYNCK